MSAEKDNMEGFLEVHKALQKKTAEPEYQLVLAKRREEERREIASFIADKWLAPFKNLEPIDKAAAIQLAVQYGLDPRLGHMMILISLLRI